MFKTIYLYEMRYWLRKPAYYLYLIIFSAIAFFLYAGTAGLFDPPSAESETLVRLVNSPFEINYYLLYLNKLMLFLLPAIIGATIHKDYKDNTHSILYSYPINKTAYLFGKFLSGFTMVVLIAICTTAAMMLAEQLPGLDPMKTGNFNIQAYVQVFSIYIFLNLFICGAIVFCVVTYFRNTYAGFVVVVVLFFLQNISENVFHGITIGLFDPFAQNAVLYETQNWTLENKNNQIIPIVGAVLYNRLIWFAFATLIFGYLYKTFAFTEQGLTILTRNNTKRTRPFTTGLKAKIGSVFPKITYDFSNIQQLKSSWVLSQTYFMSIVKSWMFYCIIAFGLMAVLFAIGRVTNNEEMAILPVTNIVLTIPAFFFSSIIILLTFIYSGMLVHKAHATKMNQLIGATSISDFTLLASKVIAIIKMQALLLSIMLLAGIIIQCYNGYYHLEIGLYLLDLFVIKFIGLTIWAFASVFIHTILKNTYVGIFTLLIGWFGISGLKELGIATRTLLFNFGEPMQYSDLNGYGHELQPYLLVKSYWFILAMLLLIVAYLFWSRGIYHSIKEQIISAKLRFNGSIKIIVSITITIFVALGFTIKNEENKIVERSSKERNKAFNDFEKQFVTYKAITNQPKVTEIDLVIDIFPEELKLDISGSYTLINKSTQPIDTILIKTGFDETTKFLLSRPSEIVNEDTYVKFYVTKLKEALQPNDSLQLTFQISTEQASIFKNNTNILHNGTFFKNDIFPRIGYFLDSDNKQPSDILASNKHYYSQDSDFISLKTTISTSKDQTAIAPGYLKKKWKEENRNYFTYQTDNKIKNSLSFSSGTYKIEKETHGNVALEIYHHNSHVYNLKPMNKGLKAAIDFNTHHFGPYQYNEARIIEFPITHGTYASVMANSIPTSEMRFIANSENTETIDISFYTIAHELTHQWWGNQVVPADAFGATMLSESVTEYLSLQIYEAHYGEKKALDFLGMQRDRYLRGRTRETTKEPPLYLVTGNQQYLAYGKGTMAFNTLSHFLGKEEMVKSLKIFFDAYKNKEAPYPTSIDLIDQFKRNTPDSIQYIIKDLFETVTFNEAAISEVSQKKLSKGDYEVNVNFSYRKYDIKNKTKSLSINDYIEIAFYSKQGELIVTKTVLITKLDNNFKFRVDTEVVEVLIDPNFILIEENRKNNSMSVTNKE